MSLELIAPEILFDEIKTEEINHESENFLDIVLVYQCNMNPNWEVLRWSYNGVWQNQNCPVRQTCNYPKYDQCKRERKYVQIGTMPCPQVADIVVVWRQISTGKLAEFKSRINVNCGKSWIFYTLP